MTCPEENALVDFVRGELPKPDRSDLEAHLDQCEACSMVVAEMARLFADESPPAEPSSPSEPSMPQGSINPSAAEWSPRLDTDGAFSPTAVTQPSGEILVEAAAQLPQGATLGRYVVIDRVGSGGMGVVYAAYDPELDRKVALKVLRGGASFEGSKGSNRSDRLMREAQAMAKLSHGNVITVHDVGTFEDQVFLAMEFIDGETLGEWMKQKQRGWAEVLDRFLAAGRGLAAAHAIDLVHRDFKPDNVLLGRDGRVLVTDFGLARPAAGKTGSFSAVGEVPSQQVLTASLTQTGALVGTPAYMAPEQLSGSRTSPLTDQFSFCVALYEALYGRRPFVGKSFAELASNLVSGSFTPPPRDVHVPRRLRRALFRGLSTNPEERFGSMTELLTELGGDPWKPWRRAGMVALPVSLALGSIAIYANTGGEARYCETIDEQLDGVWDDTRRDAMRDAFESTNAAFATDALETTTRTLDEYAAQWVEMQGNACRDQINGEQAQAVLALRMYCLDRRRESLGSVAELFTEADAAIVEGAIDAARSLPPLSPCEDLDALTTSVPPPPDDLATRKAVEEINRQIAQARALQQTAKYEETQSLARSALAAAEQAGYAPSRAEALILLATTHERQGDFETAEGLYHDALSSALGARHARVLAEASIGFVWLTGGPDRPLEEAERWATHGLAALEPLGPMAELRAQLHHALAVARMNHGELDKAQEALDKVVEIREAGFGKGHHSLGAVMSSQGRLNAMRNDLVRAIESFRAARKHVVHEYGEHHPHSATVMDNLAVALSQHGDYRQAQEFQQRALVIREATLGSDHPEVAWSHLNMAATLNALNEHEASRQHAQQARKTFITVFGPRSLEVASAATNIGSAEHSLGQLDKAREHAELAVELATEHLGPTHAKVGRYRRNLASILASAGEHERARQELMAAVEIIEATQGAEDPSLARAMTTLAKVLLLMDRDDEAVGYAERAVRIIALHPVEPDDRGDARFMLAQALWESPKHRDQQRARTMATLASQDYATIVGDSTALTEANDWLAAHPLP